MAIKELQTRIALRYDTYSKWIDTSDETKGANLVLLPGEIGICEIPPDFTANGDSQVIPTVLFKVGGAKYTAADEAAGKGVEGQLMAFKDLPWASAKAADVYSWAKASEVKRDGKNLIFVGGNADGSDLTVAFDYVTLEEVKAITDNLVLRIAALESVLEGDSDTGLDASIIESVVNIKERLDVIEGEDSGSIKKAVAEALDSAKTYADELVADVEENANDYTDMAIAGLTESFGETNAALAALISGNTAAISAIDKKFGGDYSETNTVQAAIADAKSAGTTAQSQIITLAETVGEHTQSIAANASDIATNIADILKLGSRIEKVEAFFEGAAKDEEVDGSLQNALDTLVEIQTYLTGSGEAAGALIGRVAKNETDIKSIQELLSEGGDFESRVSDNEASISNLTDLTDSLASIIEGYETKGAIKTAIDAIDEKASDAQTNVNTLVTLVGNESSGLVKSVNQLEEAIAEVTTDVADTKERLGSVEENITSIQNILTGTNSNENLREAITDLQGIVKAGANANATLRTDLTTLQNLVTNAETGLAKVKEIADDAASLASDNELRIAAIEEDYLREADSYLFSCGTASTVTYTK